MMTTHERVAGLVCHNHGDLRTCGTEQPCADGLAAADMILAVLGERSAVEALLARADAHAAEPVRHRMLGTPTRRVAITRDGLRAAIAADKEATRRA